MNDNKLIMSKNIECIKQHLIIKKALSSWFYFFKKVYFCISYICRTYFFAHIFPFTIFFINCNPPPYTSPRVCLGPILGKSPQLLSVVYLVLISIHLPHLHSKYKTNNIQSSNRKNLIFGYLGDSNNISS